MGEVGLEIKELISALNEPYGLSGHEQGISEVIKELFGKHCGEVKTDKLGNVIGIKKCGKANAKTIMIEAHMDEIGLMVKNIAEGGFIEFTTIGGIDAKILPGSECYVHGKETLYGVIGNKPPHLQQANERGVAKIENMAVDVGLPFEKVEKLVCVGDVITFKAPYTELSGTRVAARAQDDRAGIAALIKCLEEIEGFNLNLDIYAVATVQEEVGLRGAAVAAYSVNPDLAVSIDVCHGESPDAKENTYPLGKGTVVTVGPNIHPRLSKELRRIAKEYNIDCQIDVDPGNTGTNAWEIQVARSGIPTLLLSIPLRYMHTHYEVLDTADVQSTARLLAFFIKDFSEEWLCL